MKRLTAILLAAIMVFALCACGGTSEAGNSATVQAENVSDDVENTASDDIENVAPDDIASAAEEENPAIIEFTDVVLVDDDTVRIELVNFYEREYNTTNGKQVGKCFTVKATNISDHEIVLNPGKCYLNNEEVYVVMISGSITPDPGKSGNYSFEVKYNTVPDHTPLSSLDELYGLEGSFDGVNVYEDSSRNTKLKVDFSIPNAVNGEQTVEAGEPTTIYQVGDTVSTDTLEFTLTGFDFVYHLDPKTYSEKADNSGGSIGTGKDMVFANPEYTIRNVSKESIRTVDVVEFSVDYNDGYKFGMDDGNMCYIVDNPGVFWKWAGKGVGQGASLTISPLSSETYQAYIPANALIDTDSESPLLLLVTLATSSGTEEFIFQIR